MLPSLENAVGAHRMIRFASRQSAALAFLLIASCILRVALVRRGGQNYFPDEIRYYRWNLLKHLAHGDFRGGLNYVLDQPDHTGFILVVSPVAPAHKAAIRLLGLPYQWETIKETAWVGALFLSLASVACIGLTYAIARRAGGAGCRLVGSERYYAILLLASLGALRRVARARAACSVGGARSASDPLAIRALWSPRRARLHDLLRVLAGSGYRTSRARVIRGHVGTSGARARDRSRSNLRRPAAAVDLREHRPRKQAFHRSDDGVRPDGPRGIPTGRMVGPVGLLLAQRTWAAAFVGDRRCDARVVLHQAIPDLPRSRASLARRNPRWLPDHRGGLHRPYQVLDSRPHCARIGPFPVARNGVRGNLPRQPLAVGQGDGDLRNDFVGGSNARELPSAFRATIPGRVRTPGETRFWTSPARSNRPGPNSRRSVAACAGTCS